MSLEKFDNFIFFILDKECKYICGSAFLIFSNKKEPLLISASHVIGDSLGISRFEPLKLKDREINILNPKTHKKLIAKVHTFSPYIEDDICILLVLDKLTNLDYPSLVKSEEVDGFQFFSAGYREAGTRARGIILGLELFQEGTKKHKRLELSCSQVDRGMSGAPILINPNSIVGMIVSCWYSKNGKDEYTAYGVTSETISGLQSALPVKNIIQVQSTQRSNDISRKIKDFYKNVPEEINPIMDINIFKFIDLPLWQYLQDYMDESSLRFSMLSKNEKGEEMRRGLIDESSINYLLNWALYTENENLALLAEFGMGKSTIIRKLVYLLSNNHINNPNSWFPIHIDLSYNRVTQIPSSINLSDYIQNYYQGFYGIALNIHDIENILEHQKVVFLLDSFDDMANDYFPEMQKSTIEIIMREIKKIKRHKILISSRDNYFFKSRYINEIFLGEDPFFPNESFEILYLRGFRIIEINKYLELFLGENASSFWGKIKNIQDIPDLSRRPILLAMIIILKDEILNGGINNKQHLYSRFISVWLQREIRNGRLRLGEDNVRYFFENLSEIIGLNIKRSFSQEEINSLVQKEFKCSRLETEKISAEIKVCCFLGRNRNDEINFLHKSFQEFFFSEKIRRYILNDNWDVFTKTLITREILSFLKESGTITNKVLPKIKSDIIHMIELELNNGFLLTNYFLLNDLLSENLREINNFYTNIENLISFLPTETKNIHDLPENFVFIPSGKYLIGSWFGRPDEMPIRLVKIQPFALSRFQVTNKEFEEFVTDTGYETVSEVIGESKIFTGGLWKNLSGANWRNPRNDGIDYLHRLDNPVVQISWEDANAYCKWKSEKINKRVVLPTESEWEYACRAGSIGKWCFGNDESKLDEYAWYKNNYDINISTRPVGLKKPNKWGLFDMHGNVREWCDDIYEKYLGNSLYWDLENRYTSNTDITFHVLRGGHFGSTSDHLRNSIRVSGPSNFSTDYTGFRLKCIVD